MARSSSSSATSFSIVITWPGSCNFDFCYALASKGATVRASRPRGIAPEPFEPRERWSRPISLPAGTATACEGASDRSRSPLRWRKQGKVPGRRPTNVTYRDLSGPIPDLFRIRTSPACKPSHCFQKVLRGRFGKSRFLVLVSIRWPSPRRQGEPIRSLSPERRLRQFQQ
jgi:hypothetical protein